MVEPEFDGVDTSEPNCVVIGDAAEHFSYDNCNRAFQALLDIQTRSLSNSKPLLITMGLGRFYQEKGKLVIDVGAYAKALEYAADCDVLVLGKPDKGYFLAAIDALRSEFAVDVRPEDTVMIGDDLMGDVGGAQQCDMRGILVKTGKYRAGRDDCSDKVTPDAIVDNFAAAIALIIKTNEQFAN